MSAKEQYKYAQRLMRCINGISYHACDYHLWWQRYMECLIYYRADILMKAWQTL